MSRRFRILLGTTLILICTGMAALWALYTHSERTPAELIRYAERRVEGHPKLEFLALPILNRLSASLGEPGEQLPFSVPPLAANPAFSRERESRTLDTQDAGKATSEPAENEAHIIRVGRGRKVISIAMAASMAKDGDTIEIDAGDYYADVASWDRADLTIRGVGSRVRLIASGASAEDKAIWVIKRGNVTVENIDFIGARAPDRNGAGIRFESGHLIVRNCLFFDDETGLLTTGARDAELEIENSEFGYNGAGDGQTHALYVGTIKSLKVTGSYFHHANVGHLIKSRAATSYIAYNRLTDEIGGRASYELEFPNGGVAYVIGNIIQQAKQASNSTMISFGAEGYPWPTNELYLVNNTMVNDTSFGGTFLRVTSGAGYVMTRNNLLVGKGELQTPAIRDSAGDLPADWSFFAQAAREDYRLNAKGRQRTVALAGIVKGVDLTPRNEYVHPMQLKTLSAPPVFPGAIQTPGP